MQVRNIRPNRVFAPTVLLALLTLGAGATVSHFASSSPEEQLKASDQKKIGKLVSAYWSARENVKGIAASYQKLAEATDKVNASLAKKKGPEILAAVDDWEQIFWLATQSGLSDRRVKKGKVTERPGKDGAPSLTYHVGRKYTSKRAPLPLVIVVPDEGQSPSACLDTAWEDVTMRDAVILAAVHLEGDSADWGSTDAVTRVMQTYGAITQSFEFALDCRRVFLAGTGKGFAAAAATATAFPHLFAGLIGRGELGAVDVANFRNMPTFVTETDAGFAASIEQLEFGNCTKGDDASASVWAWMQDKQRVGYPTHISFSPPSAYAKSSHWINVNGVDLEADAMIDAVADRDTNTITITASGISTVDVFLNDVLVDMSGPIRIIVNGIEHETFLPRNARFMIDRVYDQGDWGRVFTQVASFDVTAAE